jgi:catechol 2,3-dioxygenase-like lactoylglutathione lyase family enzyme
MTIQRLENVGIVVDDLAAATTFFVELGLKVLGEGSVEGGWVDRVVGLEGVRLAIAQPSHPEEAAMAAPPKLTSASAPGRLRRPGRADRGGGRRDRLL